MAETSQRARPRRSHCAGGIAVLVVHRPMPLRVAGPTARDEPAEDDGPVAA
ncbi:hypothetical protein ACF07T_23805 [Streptomyces sp. NPDC015184]|uniref:hypothetical protein n=1 Tax=Streptomyces sp. NPDC015184 TaxID=3364946 RepID=UPI0036F61E65